MEEDIQPKKCRILITADIKKMIDDCNLDFSEILKRRYNILNFSLCRFSKTEQTPELFDTLLEEGFVFYREYSINIPVEIKTKEFIILEIIRYKRKKRKRK